MTREERFIWLVLTLGVQSDAIVMYYIPIEPGGMKVLLGLAFLAFTALGVGLLATLEYLHPLRLPVRERLLVLWSLTIALGFVGLMIGVILFVQPKPPGQPVISRSAPVTVSPPLRSR